VGLVLLDGTAASAATTVVDDRVTGTGNNQHEYGGSWLVGGGLSGMWASTDHWTRSPNTTVRVRFYGTDVQLTGSQAQDFGTARVSIDGGAPVTVSQRTSGSRTNDVVFFDANGAGALTEGQHTLLLTTTSNSVFTLDRTIITTSAATPATTSPTASAPPSTAPPTSSSPTTAPSPTTSSPSAGSSSPTATTTAPASSTPAATTPPASSPPPVTPAPTSPAGLVRTPEDFGANGDDDRSDTAALQAALNSLRTGETLHVAAGKVYRHDAVLVVPPSAAGARVTGTGTVMATVQERSALKVYAPDFRIDGITRRMAATTSRGTTEDHHSIFVSASGYRSTGVTIDGSHAAGYLFFGASDFVVERPVVRNTRADGIHMTYGSHDGKIVSPLVQNVGDDGVAVVSYAGAGFSGEPVSRRIEVSSPRVEGQTHGRGLTVVGGEDVTFTNVYVQGSAGAGVLIGVEGNTNKVRRVTVRGGELVDSNHRSDIDHGALFLTSGRADGSVEDVLVEGLTLRNTLNGRGSALKTSGTTGSFARVLLRDITTQGAESVEGFYPDNSIPTSSYGAVNWTGTDSARLPDRGTYRG
jgi:hypothetical protein